VPGIQADRSDVLILGAGLTGLAAAYRLGGGYRLVEKAGRPGGLTRGHLRDGFRFDQTGHWLHLRDPAMRALAEELLPGGWLEVRRRAAVFSCGVFTRYPYQVHTHGLPPEVVAENVLGFIEANYGERGRELREREPRDFAEHVLRHLGQGFARHFMFPYNRKVWTVAPESLSTEWMGRFVPRPTAEQVVRGALGLETADLGYNVSFSYPREGGIEALAAALAGRLARPAECGLEPVSIDAGRRSALLSSGETVRFRAALSTIPLPELVRLAADAPPGVREAAGQLRAATVTYVNVAARGEGPAPWHWVYLPEPSLRPYRVGAPSAVVPSLAPPGCRSFQVEMAAPGPIPAAEAEPAALSALRALGFLGSREEVLFAETRSIPHAYAIHDHDYGEARRLVRDWLEERGLFTAGRAGAWEYSSMEDALLAGRDAAARLV
jgi:protoporphyrinogen oxidase